jgi:branched-chain amino acid transport system substrate-binding protein
MHHRFRLFVGLLALPALGFSPQPSDRNDPAPIVFGMSAALTGPAADLGLNMRAGIQAAFDEVNASGGLRGQRLVLDARDDGYEPERTVPNTHAFAEDPKVLGVIGNVGTPTALVAVPIAIENDLLFFGAYTGAGALRQSPPDHVVVNVRASYAEETSAMVDALIQEAGLDVGEIAFFTQRDGYGDAGFEGGLAALERHGLTDKGSVMHVRYQRNTLAVEGALADLLMSARTTKAVIMVGAYAPCAKFIRLAREMDFDAVLLNVSFVGTDSLIHELSNEASEGVIITQVVPHFDADLPIIRDYRKAMRASFERTNTDPRATWCPTFGSLEGYLAARILIRAIQTETQPITRVSILKALEALGAFDLGLGSALYLSADEHQASHRVWPTRLHEGRVVPFDWVELAPR